MIVVEGYVPTDEDYRRYKEDVGTKKRELVEDLINGKTPVTTDIDGSPLYWNSKSVTDDERAKALADAYSEGNTYGKLEVLHNNGIITDTIYYKQQIPSVIAKRVPDNDIDADCFYRGCHTGIRTAF